MPNDSFVGVLYAYPWDLMDDGLDTSLARIVDLTGCQEVLLTPSYHVSNYFLPHNPRRPMYSGENGAVYYWPDLSRYGKTRIRPRVSREVKDPDYFDRIVEAIDRRGLRFSAWIVYLFQHYLSEKYPEFAKRDAFGTVYVGQLSPSSPDVHEYAVALTTEIMERYQPHAVRIEALQRQTWQHGLLKNKFLGDISPRCEFLLSLCFNPSSIANAEATGMDAHRFRKDVVDWMRPRLARLPTEEDTLPVSRQWIEEAFEGRLAQYLKSGRENTTALWLKVAEAIREGGGRVQSDYLAHSDRTWTNDLDPKINRSINRLTTGLDDDAAAAGDQVRGLIDDIAPGGEVYAPLGPGNILDAPPLVDKVKATAAAGAKGALFYNYGLLREAQLGFVGTALRSL